MIEGLPKNKDLILEEVEEGILIRMKRAVSYKRKGRIKEYWIQKYFKEHYRDYRFFKIEGPCQYGPDFFALMKTKKVGIEIEYRWDDYIKHEHHLDKRFSVVKYLIVLHNDKPLKK